MALSDPEVLVIGAGATGGIVAKELATAGFRVVGLAQGSWRRERDVRHDEIWINRRHALTNDPVRQLTTRRLRDTETAISSPITRRPPRRRATPR